MLPRDSSCNLKKILYNVLQMKDIFKFLVAGTHLSGTKLDFQMELYTYKSVS